MEEKCLEFYFNEDEYNQEKEQELIRQIKKEERVKEVRLEVNRNEWGVYIVKANIYQRKFGKIIYENIEENSKNEPKEKGKIEQVIYSKPSSVTKQIMDLIDYRETNTIESNKKETKKTTRANQKKSKYEKYTNRTYGTYESKGQFRPY